MLGKLPRATPAIVPPKKKLRSASAIEEITFDLSAREDYLTGFHKRKLQRIKHAQEEATKREREDKLAARKILREGRKADLEKHVEAVNSMIKDPDDVDSEQGLEEWEDEGKVWDGIQEDPAIDHEDAYVDDDRFTTVTIEAVDVSRNGLRKVAKKDSEDSEDDERSTEKSTKERPSDTGKIPPRTKRVWTKEAPNGPKKRKKNFRYESKAERKATRFKERLGNKSKAKARQV